eukprot:1150181-Pelagomonas_calceolata.AAC.1
MNAGAACMACTHDACMRVPSTHKAWLAAGNRGDDSPFYGGATYRLSACLMERAPQPPFPHFTMLAQHVALRHTIAEFCLCLRSRTNSRAVPSRACAMYNFHSASVRACQGAGLEGSRTNNRVGPSSAGATFNYWSKPVSVLAGQARCSHRGVQAPTTDWSPAERLQPIVRGVRWTQPRMRFSQSRVLCVVLRLEKD